jgi:hypothetical protein
MAAGLAVPAAAHNACVNHGEDTSCTRAAGTNPHYWLDACDRELDGTGSARISSSSGMTVC